MYMPNTPISEMNAKQLDVYVITMLNQIKAAIENKGVTVGGAAVSEYSRLIGEITGLLEAKTVIPSTSQQVIEASKQYDGLSSVTIEAVDASIDENIQSQNIKDGVTILGVEGTYVPPAPSLQNKSVTPTTSAQEISADSNYDGLDIVSVAGVTSSIDQNIVSGNIKKDIEILGVTGTFEGASPTLQSKSVLPSDSTFTVFADAGYDGLSSVEVIGVTLQDKTVTLSTSQQQVISCDSGYVGLNEVTIPAIQLQNKSVTLGSSQQVITADSQYDGLGQVTVPAVAMQSKSVVLSSSSQTITPDSGYTGLSQVDVPAVVLEPKSVTPSTSQQVINKSAGYDGIGTVTVSAVDASIDSSIKSQNIKDGVIILGVTGSYTGGGVSPSQYINIHPTQLAYAYSENSDAQNDLWNLGSIPELDTSAVTTMYNCFRSNSQVTVLDLSTWSFASCTNTQYMFAACHNLTKVTFPVNTPLKSIANMFNNCTSLEEIAGSLNLSQCNAINATNSIFFGCKSLKKIQISDFSYNANQTLDLSASTVFDAAYLLNSLPAYTGSRTKTIKVNSAVISQQLIDDYAAKGYTLTSA